MRTTVSLMKSMNKVYESANTSLLQGQCLLTVWTLASIAGNDQQAMEYVTTSVQELALSEQQLSRLQTAVAEATRNAIEHGNQYRSDLVVTLQVLISQESITVRIHDQGVHLLISDPPDLATKLAEPQTGRGWGLYLIKHLVDHWQFRNGTHGHTIELTMHRHSS